MLVFAVEVEDLEAALAGLFEEFAAVFAGLGGLLPEAGEALVEAGGEFAFAGAPGLVGGPAFLAEDAVFLEAEAVELVAECEVATQVLGEAHEAGAVSGGAEGEGEAAGRRRSSFLTRWSQSSWLTRQRAMRRRSSWGGAVSPPRRVTISS